MKSILIIGILSSIAVANIGEELAFWTKEASTRIKTEYFAFKTDYELTRDKKACIKLENKIWVYESDSTGMCADFDMLLDINEQCEIEGKTLYISNNIARCE